ncbi:N-acetylmannosamine kinase [Spirabiliibacterium falconis]|uniref:N-acetylmannosamine kinase n=1 Tax=Spirabiliibacterium falconis TaxID=572023 RepID=UPI001AACCAD8|nr:N-acetylmannosamine kinase [Spirabiliibacterium falconis]MBE2894878.1 N-acetylmannosamine kinase [Spirabiliibacterium falconis]
MKCCLAIDIGKENIDSALVTGQILEDRQQFPLPQGQQNEALEQTLKAIFQHYKGMFDAVAVVSDNVQDGPLSALNPNKPAGLATFPLEHTLHQCSYHHPVGIVTRLQATTYSQYRLNAPTEVKNFAYIDVDKEVGGGLVLGGELQIGSKGIAGHIGHTLADPNGPTCACGRRGCVDAMASANAMVHFANMQGAQSAVEDIFAQYQQGDPEAVAMLKRSAQVIANLVADLVVVDDVECVALGGSVGLSDGYLSLVKTYLIEQPHFYHCEVVKSSTVQDERLIGAALWLNENLANRTKK